MLENSIINPKAKLKIMGNLLPVFSGVKPTQVPDPAPENILVSITDCALSENATKKFRNLIKRSCFQKTFLDNGMYTFHKKIMNDETVIFDPKRPVYPNNGIAMNLTAEHVAHYARILQPHVTFTLDLPVPKLTNIKPDPGLQEFNFMRATYHNLTRARELVNMKPTHFPNTDLYFVFQIYNIQQLVQIKKELGNIGFDGYAVPTRTLSWKQVAAVMLMLHHWKAERVHIFAGSNLKMMVVSAVFARHFFEEVSYDSTNWIQNSMYNKFRLYGSLKTVGVENGNVKQDQYNDYQCRCPHCDGRSIRDIRDMEYTPRTSILSSHNQWIEQATAKEIMNHVDSAKDLCDYLSKYEVEKSEIIKLCDLVQRVLSMRKQYHNFEFVKSYSNIICKAI